MNYFMRLPSQHKRGYPTSITNIAHSSLKTRILSVQRKYVRFVSAFVFLHKRKGGIEKELPQPVNCDCGNSDCD